MTSPKLLLAAGSIAASLAGIGPAVTHGTTAPVRTSPAGLTVAAGALRAGASVTTAVSVPAGKTRLVGTASGSPALAGRIRLTVRRATDGAVLFTGSLATFRDLQVQAGTPLLVSLRKPAGYGGLKASGMLQWS